MMLGRILEAILRLISLTVGIVLAATTPSDRWVGSVAGC